MSMFLTSQNKTDKQYYSDMLKCIGSLSRLFSESKEPYIQYRIAENLFCKSFNAKNLSRTDCSADASKDRVGIGIKTFLEVNGSTWQKVAEFNGDHGQFKSLGDKEKVKKVANLRNIRIDTTKRIFDLDKMIYHCVTRKPGRILVYELPMDSIVVGDIKKIKKNKNIISFDDGLNSYSFNISKSTLYKRFNTGELLLDLPVEILDDPFDSLEKLLSTTQESISFSSIKKQEHIFLPLYSMKDGKKVVPDKSGLNQWKASGRKRDYNEIYIPIPSWIHSKFPGFFPSRDTAFTLILPNGKEMSAKLCQDGSKALMSNPNSDLGKWLLRDVLNLKEGEVLNYDFLDNIGLDSVVIYKNNEGEYDIDFTAVGSYEDFKEESY